jgi:membrane dipeptidase
MFRHLDYIGNLVGPQHLGIGLDYVKDLGAIWKWTLENPELWPANNGASAPEPAHAQPEQIAELASLMLSRGYTEGDVRGILGGNFLRVMRAAQAARDKSQVAQECPTCD